MLEELKSTDHNPPIGNVNVGQRQAPAEGPEKTPTFKVKSALEKSKAPPKKQEVRGRREEKKSNQTSRGADEEPR